MSTAELTGNPAGVPGERTEGLQKRAQSAIRVPVAIAGALLVLVLYAAFDHGAVALPVDTRIEVAIAAIALVGALGWAAGTLRLSAPADGILGIVLLVAFACWAGVTVLWSVAPDQTWIELNRALAYATVLCLAIAVGSSYARAIEVVARGFLAVALAVTVYALGQKLLPGLHLGGLFNLNQTGPLPRLQEPLGYWNALALFVALGVPVALAIAVDTDRRPGRRLAAACAIQLMVLAIGLTYSRGGLIALAVALLVAIWTGGERPRALVWTVTPIVAAIPPLAFGLTSHSLTTAGVALSSREGAGAVLALILVVSLAALVLAGRALLALDPQIRVEPSRVPRLRRLAVAAGAVIVVGALLAIAVSSRGLTGTFSHAWDSFTATRPASNSDPSRLLSADSQNRWVWWKEAAHAFGERPVQGWGAGSFGVLHLMFRHNTLPVQQPHSVPLQLLAETGLVGAVLAIAAYLLLLRSAAGTVRRRPPGAERLLGGALLAGVAAYGVHCLYDWDWNIPAVTLPVLVFTGVLIGARSAPGPRGMGAGLWGRLLFVAVVTVWLCAFALSAALPSIAASKANSALIEASSTAPGALENAQRTAALASSLDPLSDAGLRAQATIAVHRGRLGRARDDLVDAVGRDPTDEQAWDQLSSLYTLLGDARDARIAARRVIALDPRGPIAASLEMRGYGP